MKTAAYLILLIVATSVFFSCQKPFAVEQSFTSTGTLVKDAAGNCAPVTINGLFKAGVLLAATNYIDVSVNVTATGSYAISTDTLNGIYFSASGDFTSSGTQSVRLTGHGTPTSAGAFAFTAHYGNSSSCAIQLTVSPAGTTVANFTLTGAPGACTTPIIQGTYTAGTILDPSNKIIINVNVTGLGDYNLTTGVVNGISFSATGTFTSLGNQPLTLSGSGTPLSGGTNSMSISGTVASCSFPLTVGSVPTSGTKIKRIIQSEIGTRQSYITALTYDANNRLLTFKEWEEDSSFTPIKITWSNYSSFTYAGTGEYPIKNTITHETAGTDSTLYSYDGMNRVVKEDCYFNGQVSVRNVFAYLSPGIVLQTKYTLTSPGPALHVINTDSLIFDAQNRITEIRSYNASNVYAGIHTYQYDNKNNPFFLINLFKYAYTLYGDDAKVSYRSPNNFTFYNQTTFPSGSTTININYTTYNSGSYPLYGTGSITNVPGGTQNSTIVYEYY